MLGGPPDAPAAVCDWVDACLPHLSGADNGNTRSSHYCNRAGQSSFIWTINNCHSTLCSLDIAEPNTMTFPCGFPAIPSLSSLVVVLGGGYSISHISLGFCKQIFGRRGCEFRFIHVTFRYLSAKRSLLYVRVPLNSH